MSDSIRSSITNKIQRSKSSSRSTTATTRRPSVVEASTSSHTSSSSYLEVGTKSLSPMLRLAANRQFDKIENDLRNQSTGVEFFLSYGKQQQNTSNKTKKNVSKCDTTGSTGTHAMHHSMTTVDTVPNSMSSSSGSSRNTYRRSRISFHYIKTSRSQKQPPGEQQLQPQQEHYPTTPLHKILEYQPPYSTVSILCRALTNNNYQQQEDQMIADRKYHHSSILQLPTMPVDTVTSTATNNNMSSPSPVDVTDDMGRKPLHIACEYGCDLNVVKRLLKGTSYARPFMTCDVHKRTPLHYACANPRGNNISSNSNNATAKLFKTLRIGPGNNSNNSKRCDNMIQIIECLVSMYPRAAILQDVWGQTPLDLAIENKATSKIIELLSKTSEKVYYAVKHRQQRINVEEEQEQSVVVSTAAPLVQLEIEQETNQQLQLYQLPKSLALSETASGNTLVAPNQTLLEVDEQIEDSSTFDLLFADTRTSVTTAMSANHLEYLQQRKLPDPPGVCTGTSSLDSRIQRSRRIRTCGSVGVRTCGSVGGRTLVKLNEYPIDLDKEMEKMKLEYLTCDDFGSNRYPNNHRLDVTNNTHSNFHQHSLDDSDDMTSPLDLVIECKIGTTDASDSNSNRCDEDIVDDTSSLGSDCISKHYRPRFEPFVNVHELVDI